MNQVSFAYPHGKPVLRDMSLELRAGERVGLVGPNGSGKTTLLHLIVGLLKPDAGEIFAFGCKREQEDDFVEVRKRAGFMFQRSDDQLFCPTVMEDVAFGPLNLGRSKDEAVTIAHQVMARLRLEGYAERITHHLSEGEKRRVCLATVLAMEPEVLLLDEPVSGLDQEAQELVMEILLDLPQAMLIVAHEREFLEKVADREVKMQTDL